MPTIIQKSFSGGEIAPALYARTDISKYATGLRTCRNMAIQKHGGARNRPGTQFVAEVKDSSAEVRLIPFIFNDDQTYVLEFGNQYIRFHTDGAPIRETAVNISSTTAADPVVVTANSHGYSNGEYVYINGVAGQLEVNNRTYIVSGATTNTFQLQDLDGNDVDGSTWSAGTGGTVARVYEISSPYVTADLLRLKFAQTADVLTIVHPSYQPRNLARTSDTSWSLNTTSGGGAGTGPSLTGAAGDALISTGASGSDTERYRITTFNKVTGVETTGRAITISSVNAASNKTLRWRVIGAAPGSFGVGDEDVEFNVYKWDDDQNKFGLLDIVENVATSASNVLLTNSDTVVYTDTNGTIDFSVSLPSSRDTLFTASDDYPGAIGYIQQRRMYAATNNDPEKVWGSRIGSFSLFTTFRSPVQDNDPLEFIVAGSKVNEVRHLVNLAKAVVMTQSGSWVLEGNDANALTPTQIYPKQHSYRSVAHLRPLIIDDSVVYLDGRQSIVRDLGYQVQADGYRGDDLSIFSSHLFDAKTVVDWDYAENPNSIVWAARSDGAFLGFTYIKEQSMFAWHRHDFDGGEAERVCSVPEDTEDGVYFVVKRTINGATRRYIERFRKRTFTDIKDAVFMDASFTFDGRNTGSTTMTLSGGSTWAFDETLTLTASASFFLSTDIGNNIVLNDSNGDPLRCEITAFTSATVVSIKPHKTVPTSLRNTATTDWAEAVDQVFGLWDLEGQDVSVLGDGFVVASPKNNAYDKVTVSNGSITLNQPYSVIHVGLPFVSDIETLDIEVASDGTLIDRDKFVTEVNMYVQESRGIWTGPVPPTSTTDLLDGLTELKIRNTEGYDDPVRLVTDKVAIQIPAEWNSNGRVFIRQVDPLPLSILAIAPSGGISGEGV